MTAAVVWKFLTSPLGKWLGATLAVVLVLGGVYLKGRSDGEANVEAAVAAANKKADERAAALSNELVIQQAIAMSATAKKANSYVQQIQAAPDDGARMRAGSVGVRDIIHGTPNAPK